MPCQSSYLINIKYLTKMVRSKWILNARWAGMHSKRSETPLIDVLFIEFICFQIKLLTIDQRCSIYGTEMLVMFNSNVLSGSSMNYLSFIGLGNACFLVIKSAINYTKDLNISSNLVNKFCRVLIVKNLAGNFFVLVF